MEDTERAHLLESLIGVSASRRTYYSEYRENERRLDRAIASLAIISAALCNTTSGVPSLAQAVVQVAVQHFDAPWAVIALNNQAAQRWIARRGNDGLAVLASHSAPPALAQAVEQVLDQQRLIIVEEFPGARMLGAPMFLSDQVVGALVVMLNREFVIDERELSVLRTLANQAAVAVENARLYEESEQLRARAVELYQDTYRQKTELEEMNRQLAKARHRLAAAHQNQILNNERARIARDLHDSVAQHLISIGMTLEWCRVQLDPHSPIYERICNAKEIARSAVTRMRETIFQLAPISDGQSSLTESLRDLALDFEKTTDLHVQLRTTGCPRLISVEAASALYYVAQEALFNAYKHARARHITLGLRFTRSTVRLVVADDGIGMAAQAPQPGAALAERTGFGLRNMRERAHEIGGTLQIIRPTGGGTELRISIPLRVASQRV
ncbi:MAG: GAF domain-containing sensor histidine kinase [Chloroflexales bacterium]|nr:GAF domain-containing sensor histidine kinase [Chloroflexales bacterium]